jgi:hypothetical protein
MSFETTLWDLEQRFWTEGADFARRASAKDAIFVFPYPAGILQGDTLFRESDVAQRWRTVKISQRSLTRHGAIAVLAYHASAERAGSPLYEALCVSTYLLDDDHWLRLSHQQTPAAPPSNPAV